MSDSVTSAAASDVVRAGTALSKRPRAVRGGILLAATLVIGIVADIVFENPGLAACLTGRAPEPPYLGACL